MAQKSETVPPPAGRVGSRPPKRPRSRPWIAAACVLVALVSIVAIAVRGDDEPERAPLPEASGGAPQSRTSFLTKIIPPPPERVRGPRVPSSVGDLARRLPLERKVAQLFAVGFSGRDLTAPVFRRLRRLDLGAIVVQARNYESPQQLAQMTGEAGVISRQERHVPPWLMISQEGGAYSEIPELPPVREASELANPREAARETRRALRTLKLLGLNAFLAPVVDVGTEESPDGPRAYSDDPLQVAEYATASVRVYERARVLSAPKFFPGHGAASQSTETGPATVGFSVDELLRRDLVPFQAAFRAGAPAVVVGHASFASDDFVIPASLSRIVMTDLLRRRLRFRGIAITDDLSSPAITTFTSVPEAAVDALRAGADMLYVTGTAGDQEAAYNAVVNAARRRAIPRKRIDEALLRVLKAKADQRLIR